MAHHDIHFTMHHNEHLLFDLPSANRKQRILSIFGKKYNERLVPIEETTSISKIHGFVVKPEFAKRTRGEQFIFVNNRFIKNSSINHAITVSFKDLISRNIFLPISYLLKFRQIQLMLISIQQKLKLNSKMKGLYIP